MAGKFTAFSGQIVVLSSDLFKKIIECKEILWEILHNFLYAILCYIVVHLKMVLMGAGEMAQ